MRRPLTVSELAELAGIDVGEVQEYRSRGLIDPDGDGSVDELDILRLRILMHHRSLGQSVERIEEAISAGSTGVMYADLLWGRGDEFLSPVEVAERAGMAVSDVEALLRGIGLSGGVPVEDVKFFEALKALVDGGIPIKVLLEVARVYGDTMRRLAQTEVRTIRDFVTESGRSSILKERSQSERLQSVQDLLGPILEPMLLAVHRRHLLRASVAEVVADLEAAERGQERQTLEATIVFVDLVSFTSLAQIHGDEVAATTLDRFDELVRQLSDEHGGTLIKQIGDAFMLVFAEPAPAVRFAVGLDATAAREPNFPALRWGIHSGPVLYRVGDYVGNTVNLASRIATLARANDILITEPVAEAATEIGVNIAPAGEHELAGVEGTILLWRLGRRAMAPIERDPVCGMAVGENAAARIVYRGRQYAFCSHDCLRRFLDDPERHVSEDRAAKPET